MKAYIFFSVHEELFHRVSEQLRSYGVESFAGFAWGVPQLESISGRGIDYNDAVVFSRDLLPKVDDGQAPDLAWLAKREQELGVSIQRMLVAERHLLKGRTYEQIMRMAEVGLREIAAALDRIRPDFIFSEDISCFHSYAHYLLARERGIPCWCIGTGRLPYRVSLYKDGTQRWTKFESLCRTYRDAGITPEARRSAEEYLNKFRDRPVRPPGMDTRAKRVTIERKDASMLRFAAARYFADPGNPTSIHPLRVIQQRLSRLARVAVADARGVFEKPVAGENYVLYPIHFQPEASTLVQSPLYIDQVNLMRDIAASLPVGFRLYVKEHVSNRGRRPIEFYDAIRAIPAVRLLGPDEDTFALIRGARVVTVITGTVGWEGLIFGKPVITFGDVFFNQHPSVYRAFELPKDAWYDMFTRAASPAHVHDAEATLALVAALDKASYPGAVGNPTTFPQMLDPQNVHDLAYAIASEVGLTRSSSAS